MARQGFTAVLDANVLYPAPIRDYLLHLASLELYKPKWTAKIQEEWIRNLLVKRADIKRKSLEMARDAMNSAFPDANIGHDGELENELIEEVLQALENCGLRESTKNLRKSLASNKNP